APRASGASRARDRSRSREVARGPASHREGVRRRPRQAGPRAARVRAAGRVDGNCVRRGHHRVDRVAWMAHSYAARGGARPARGPQGFLYPWGNRWEPGRANADSLRDGFAPAAASSLGRSWVGAVDLIGNAWEWTTSAAADARGQPGHVIKGGAFDTPSATAT